MEKNGIKRWILVLILAVWAGLMLAGFRILLNYSNTAGESAGLHRAWPEESRLLRMANKATLVMFVHPQCPCSEASIGELERLIPWIKGRIESLVVFHKPKNRPESWVRKRIWKQVQAIPGVRAFVDEGGLEADRFDARTSGQTFLFDEYGELIFSGGITPGRGHMGNTRGKESILAFAKTGNARFLTTSVFGCSLIDAP